MKPKRDNLEEYLMEQQLGMIGLTFDALGPESSIKEFKILKDDFEIFKKQSIKIIKKVLKCNRSKAERAFMMFYSVFGFTIIELPKSTDYDQKVE